MYGCHFPSFPSVCLDACRSAHCLFLSVHGSFLSLVLGCLPERLSTCLPLVSVSQWLSFSLFPDYLSVSLSVRVPMSCFYSFFPLHLSICLSECPFIVFVIHWIFFSLFPECLSACQSVCLCHVSAHLLFLSISSSPFLSLLTSLSVCCLCLPVFFSFLAL